jgi:hypothetical protein
MEGGATKYLKANENTTYEIPLDDAEAATVNMDGLDLYEKVNDGIPDIEVDYGLSLVPVFVLNKEGRSVGVYVNDQTLLDVFDTTNKGWLDSNFIASTTTSTTFTLKGELKYRCTKNTVAGKLRIFFSTVDPVTMNSTDYQVYDSGANPEPVFAFWCTTRSTSTSPSPYRQATV